MGISSTATAGNGTWDAYGAAIHPTVVADEDVRRVNDLRWWRNEIESAKNKQGRMGDFYEAMTGTKLKRSEYGRIFKLLQSFPGGVQGLMSAICEAAIRDLDGDPLAYVQKLADSPRWKAPVAGRKKENYDGIIQD